MVLQLDPSLPLVWRTPTSLQLGVSSPVVVLHDVDEATERMIAALSAGVTRPGLGMIGRSAGATEDHVDELVHAVSPALVREAATPKARVVIVGRGRTADRIGRLLSASRLDVVIARDVVTAENQACDFAIAVGDFVLEPELHGLWLRRDLPHLPVVLGDSAVVIGPIVEPGSGPCLYCLQKHATDADPAWPAIATQLWGKPSAADTELVASEVAALVTRLTLARLSGGASRAAQLTLDVATGTLDSRRVDPHPDCGCLEPAVSNAAVLPENDSPAVDPIRGWAPQPRRA